MTDSHLARLHAALSRFEGQTPRLEAWGQAAAGRLLARAWGWPGLVPAERVADTAGLDALWDWCLSAEGRRASDSRCCLLAFRSTPAETP